LALRICNIPGYPMTHLKKHVLMISIGEKNLSDPLGDPIERHKEYASRIGKISMVLYTRNKEYRFKSFNDKFLIYPTNSASKIHFIFDALKICKRIINQEKVDLISTQDPFGTGLVGVILKKKFNIPVEIQNHSTFIDNRSWILEKPFFFSILNLLAKKIVIPRGDVLRVMNKKEKETYMELGIEKNRIHVIHTPINLDQFLKYELSANDEQKIKSELGMTHDYPVLVWVGRPVGFKRIDLLLKVFDEVSRRRNGFLYLLLIGDIELLKPSIRKYLEQIRNRGVITPGKISHDRLPGYFRIADICVLTSEYEGMPKAPIEAMASQLPVVATELPGLKDYIQNGKNGYLVNSYDPVEFADFIEMMLRQSQKMKMMGQYAHKFAEKTFNREDSINRIVEVWRGLL